MRSNTFFLVCLVSGMALPLLVSAIGKFQHQTIEIVVTDVRCTDPIDIEFTQKDAPAATFYMAVCSGEEHAELLQQLGGTIDEE